SLPRPPAPPPLHSFPTRRSSDLFFRPAQQQSYVVARNPFIEQLPEHLHTGHNLFLRRTETHNLDFFAHFHFAPFDSSRHHRAAKIGRAHVLNRHRNRLVHIAPPPRYL